MSVTWESSALVAAHTGVLNTIDAGTAAAYLEIRDAGDVLLSTLPFTDPAGTVDSGTGQLTIVFGARDEQAAATGTASYGEIKDSDGNLVATADCIEGTAPVAGNIVLSTVDIVINTPVEGVSFTIG